MDEAEVAQHAAEVDVTLTARLGEERVFATVRGPWPVVLEQLPEIYRQLEVTLRVLALGRALEAAPPGHVRRVGETPAGPYVVDVPLAAIPAEAITGTVLNELARPQPARARWRPRPFAPSSRRVLHRLLVEPLRAYEVDRLVLRQLVARGHVTLHPDGPPLDMADAASRPAIAHFLAHALPRAVADEAIEALTRDDAAGIDTALRAIGLSPTPEARVALWDVLGRPRKNPSRRWWWDEKGDLLLYLRRAVQMAMQDLPKHAPPDAQGSDEDVAMTAQPRDVTDALEAAEGFAPLVLLRRQAARVAAVCGPFGLRVLSRAAAGQRDRAQIARELGVTTSTVDLVLRKARRHYAALFGDDALGPRP